ncbi:MAG: ROK family protein [Lactovum sp.]
MKNLLTIDIGGSSIKYADFSLEGQLLSKNSFEVPKSFDELLDKIKKLFQKGDYDGISISSPGAIDSKTGKGYGISAIDYIPCGGNLKEELEKSLNISIAIDNDANCAALSEIHFSKDLNSIAYLVLGSGVGGAVIIDGKVVSGSSFFAGEFGYIPYKDSTYSGYAGMLGLSKHASHQKEEVISGLEIFKNYDLKIEEYVTAVNEYYEALASLLSVIKYTFNPEKIILSGAITNRSTFLEELQEATKLFEKDKDYQISDIPLSISQFTSDANLYGAYANLIRNYF